jgi:TolA-binding protein
VRAKTPTEKHFQAGWDLLRAGKAADAAIELGAAADASTSELASDARYFQAVALIRAGHSSEAERALVAFLDHAPRSTRRGRAAVMLGRLIAARGDRAGAKAWFESALHDGDPDVVAAARAELAAKP